MKDSDSLYLYRLALSYLQKVETEIAKWGAVRSKQKIELTRYDSIRSVYSQHRDKAQEAVDAHLARAKEELDPLKEELRLSKRQQRKLLEQAAAGSISAARANEQNRALTKTIADLETRIATAQAIVDAKDVNDVGGFISMPIQEYEKKLIAPKPAAKTRAEPLLSPSTSIAAIAVLLLVGLAAYLYVTFGGTAKASFEVEVLESNSSLIRIVCRNEGSKIIPWYVPWPEGDPRTPGADASSFGILLYAMEKDSDTPRLVPNTPGCWEYRGAELMDSGPLDVRPGLAVNVLLNTARLRELGVEAAALRLVFTRRGGAEVGRFETVLE